MNVVKQAKTSFICFSILSIILGVCLIIWPHVSAETICIVFGLILLLTGVLRIVFYFKGTVFGIPLYADLTAGFLILLVGALLIIHPGDAASLLPIVAGLSLIFDGAFKLQPSADLRRVGVKYWWYILILSILTSACGVLLVLNPFAGLTALMVALGVCLILDGIQNICTVAYVSRFIKKEMPIYANYTFK